MEFSFAKVEVLYDEKNHDGYCSGAEEDDDLALSHTVEMIMSIPDGTTCPDVDIDKFVAAKHDLFGKYSTGWKNCNGSGYCDIESNRTVTKVTICKKKYIPIITIESDTKKKISQDLMAQQISDTALNIHRSLDICLLERRITIMRLLREKFSDIQSPEDVRINEIINHIELNVLYRNGYAQSYLKITDYDLLIKRIEPVVQAIVDQTKYNNCAVMEYNETQSDHTFNQSCVKISCVEDIRTHCVVRTKSFKAKNITPKNIGTNNMDANNTNNTNVNNMNNVLNALPIPASNVDITNCVVSNITDTKNIVNKKHYRTAKLCAYSLIIGALCTGTIYWYLHIN